MSGGYPNALKDPLSHFVTAPPAKLGELLYDLPPVFPGEVARINAKDGVMQASNRMLASRSAERGLPLCSCALRSEL